MNPKSAFPIALILALIAITIILGSVLPALTTTLVIPALIFLFVRFWFWFYVCSREESWNIGFWDDKIVSKYKIEISSYLVPVAFTFPTLMVFLIMGTGAAACNLECPEANSEIVQFLFVHSKEFYLTLRQAIFRF